MIPGPGDGQPGFVSRAGRIGAPVIVISLGAIGIPLLFGWYTTTAGVPHEDLEVYRFGVQAWWSGGDIYGPLPETSAGAHLPFLYPPFAVLALSPLAVLPWSPAVLLLFALNSVCLIATFVVVARAVAPQLSMVNAVMIASALMPLMLLLEPVHQTFSFGQVNLLLMALVAVDCLARKPVWPRGLGVGIAAAIKLTPAAFLLFFLVRKDYRAADVAAATTAVATAIGFAIDWHASIRYWFSGFDLMSWMSGTPYKTNQTIEGSVARYDLGEPLHTVTWVVLMMVLLGMTVLAMRRTDAALALLLNAALALLASPTSWSHHWVWVAPALIMMAGYTIARWQQDSPATWSWLSTTTLTAALFYLAPFHLVPGAEDAELQWTGFEQPLGNAYVWFTAALIIGYAATLVIRQGGRSAHVSPRREREATMRE